MKSSSGSYPMHSTRVIQWCQEHAKAADVLIPVHTSVSVTTTAFLLGKQKNTWVNVLKPGERRQNVSSLGYFPGDHCWLLVTLGHPKPTHSFMESSYSQRQGNESESSVWGIVMGLLQTQPYLEKTMLLHSFFLCILLWKHKTFCTVTISDCKANMSCNHALWLCFLHGSQSTLQRKIGIAIPI